MKKRAGSRRRVRVVAAAAAIAAAALLWDARRSARAPVSTLKPAPLTNLPGSETYPAFSPDGTLVAFSWRPDKAGETRHICVKRVGQDSFIQLTRGDGDDVGPAWSPDGGRIAFTRLAEDGSGYFVVPALGGAERKLAGFPDVAESEPLPRLDWTSEGRAVAIAEKEGVTLLPVDGGEKKRITTPPGNTPGDRSPVVSPDGRSVAFLRQSEASREDIYVTPIAGGRARRITWDNDRIQGLAWAPDSGSLIYASPRMHGMALWKISASGGTSQPLRDLPRGEYPALSRTGRLAFARTTPNTKIWRIDVPAQGRFKPPARLSFATRLDAHPQFSPDGQRIAFVSDRSGSEQIWVCDSRGENPAQLTRMTGRRPSNLRWSPAGDRIVFEYREVDRPNIYVIGLAGGAPKQLTREGGWLPGWSRDGNSIYYCRDALWRIPAEGGERKRISRTWASRPVESLDGAYVYFYARGSIWRVRPDGSDEGPVSDSLRLPHWLSWTVARNGIFFTDHERSERKVVIQFYNLETRSVTQVAEMEGARWQSPLDYSVSGDGRHVWYSQPDESQTDLMILENFR